MKKQIKSLLCGLCAAALALGCAGCSDCAGPEVPAKVTNIMDLLQWRPAGKLYQTCGAVQRDRRCPKGHQGVHRESGQRQRSGNQRDGLCRGQGGRCRHAQYLLGLRRHRLCAGPDGHGGGPCPLPDRGGKSPVRGGLPLGGGLRGGRQHQDLPGGKIHRAAVPQ